MDTTINGVGKYNHIQYVTSMTPVKLPLIKALLNNPHCLQVRFFFLKSLALQKQHYMLKTFFLLSSYFPKVDGQ